MKNKTSLIAGSKTLIKHTLNLCHLAKKAGLSVTSARKIDIFNTIQQIDLSSVNDYETALTINLASSRAEEKVFHKVFHSYWNQSSFSSDGDYILSRSEMIRGSLTEGRSNEGHREMLSEVSSSGSEHVTRRSNLAARWDKDAPPLNESIRKLAKILANKSCRREKTSKKGKKIDIKNTVRKNISTGSSFMTLFKRAKQVKKTRMIILCDVSGSMDIFNAFLLQLMFGIQRLLTNSRTFVFSTKVTEVSHLLRKNSVDITLEEISRFVRHWSGGTDIGNAIKEINKTVLRNGRSKSTVLVIISDGYDSGSSHLSDEKSLAKELKIVKQRLNKLVWINPMYGASSFEIKAKALKTAIPFVDHFLPAYNGKALHALVKGLTKI